MDLATGAKRLIVTMTHTSRDGIPKVVPACTLPLTASGVVDLLVTDLAVFAFGGGRMVLTETMPDVTVEGVRAATTAPFTEAVAA
ncbi:CoA-transferase [Rubricoccus marinus]|uniref:Uncharacterized protein n=1 Tax=Rubricoccus marinus TaxID=716817 RepID=A0A259TUH4_9BACT|nr:CoA-transferase [Rubricoccus marinus]OZC01208.1 hypothetical protein BSZ36_18305 [Rubricoccus marinus]